MVVLHIFPIFEDLHSKYSILNIRQMLANMNSNIVVAMLISMVMTERSIWKTISQFIGQYNDVTFKSILVVVDMEIMGQHKLWLPYESFFKNRTLSQLQVSLYHNFIVKIPHIFIRGFFLQNNIK